MTTKNSHRHGNQKYMAKNAHQNTCQTFTKNNGVQKCSPKICHKHAKTKIVKNLGVHSGEK